MAGQGPAPKTPDQRRRRNEPARGEWVDLLPLEEGEVYLPDLPERFDGAGWSKLTCATWEAWRNDPVTQMYSPADVAYALDAIRLYEEMTPSSANEVRLRMDSLGLTPKGKRDLRWRIVQEDDDGEGDDRKKPRRSSKGTDRRARLSVVK